MEIGLHKQTLPEWEKLLTDLVGDGEILLGQLPDSSMPFTRDDRDELGYLLGQRFHKQPVESALRLIGNRYPLSFALYLVLEGIFEYEQGRYWDAVLERLGLQGGNLKSKLGEVFRDALRRKGLPRFGYIQGKVNMVPILLHGGIPEYCLDDFFKLLHKSLRDRYIVVDAETLLEEWRGDLEDTFLFIDKPVERFLLHGGGIAEDFLTRCILLTQAATQQEIDELDLPERVVAAYRQWRDEADERLLLPDRPRLARPFLYLEPYAADGVCLALPPQRFPATTRERRLIWTIDAGITQRQVETDRLRVQSGYEFVVEDEIRVPVTEAVTAALKTDRGLSYSWHLEASAPGKLMLFDVDSGRLLGETETRQPGDRWILFPNDCWLEVTHGQKTGELPQQYGGWGQFTVEEWTLEPDAEIRLQHPDGILTTLKLSSDLGIRRPYFDGGYQPLAQHGAQSGQKRGAEVGRMPLFRGSPPAVAIPFSGPPTRRQLARWRINILPEGDARPADRRSIRLDTLDESIQLEEKRAVVDLSHPSLLGPAPCGTFEINARGPYGRGRRLGLRIVPFLQIKGHRQIYFSAAEGRSTVEVSCRMGDQLRLTSGINIVTENDARYTPNRYRYLAEPDVTALRVIYWHKEGVRVPFSIRLRRLRWRLWSETLQDEPTWQTAVIRLHPHEIDDIAQATLFVDLPTMVGEDEPLYGGWRLIDGTGHCLKERRPDRSRSRQQLEIRIADLLADFRQAEQRKELISLQIWIEQGAQAPRFIDALLLLPELEVGQASTKLRWTEETVEVELRADRLPTTNNLKLALWLADAPWLGQVTLCSLNTGKDGSSTCTLDRKVLAWPPWYEGDLVGRLAIVDPWSGMLPERPVPGENGYLEFRAADRFFYEVRAAVAEDDECAVDDLLVLLSHAYRRGDQQDFHSQNYRIRSQARSQQFDAEDLIAWANLTAKLGDPTAHKLALFTLFHRDVLLTVGPALVTNPRLQATYMAHLQGATLSGEQHATLLELGITENRLEAIKALCGQDIESGLPHLLTAVDDGELTLVETAGLLKPSSELIALLRRESTEISRTLLSLLESEAGVETGCLRLQDRIRTEFGLATVLDMYDRDGLRKAFFFVDDSCLLKVRLQTPHGNFSGRIELPEKILDLDARRVIQCRLCNAIADRREVIIRHIERDHPDSLRETRTVTNGRLRLQIFQIGQERGKP